MTKKVVKGVNDLASKYPEIAKEWDYEKNGDLKPEEVTYGSNEKVWWKCNKGHSYKATISSRTLNGTGCPFCSNNKILKGFNDLATTDPEKIKYWDYDKNSYLPEEFTRGSNKKNWWLCDKKHSFEMPIKDFVSSNYSCPICRREKHSSFPEQAILFYVKQFFPDAINGDKEMIGMELDIYIPSIKTAIEYDGMTWHSFSDSFEKEKKKNNLCQEKEIFLIRIREKGLQFHDDCFCISRADNFSTDSLNKVIENVLKKIGVSNCSIDVERDNSKILSSYILSEKEKSLSVLFPEIAKEWNYEKNGKLSPSLFRAGSHRKVWWKCEKGHDWQASIKSRQKNGCPICSGKKVLSGYNDLATLCPEIASQWDYKENNDLRPEDVTKSSHKEVFWLCENGHSWKTKIDSRTRRRSGCPFCSNQKVLPGYNDLLTKFPKIAAEWDQEKNGDLKPSDVIAGTRKKAWFLCSNNHSYYASIAGRTSSNHGCPICAGRQVLKGFNDFSSFSPNLISEWNYEKNGDLNPDQMTRENCQKVWWKCTKGHEWQDTLKNRTRQKGIGCPICRSFEFNKRNPPVVCVETGIIYKNAKDALIDIKGEYGRSFKNIYKGCNNPEQIRYGYHWRLATEEEKASIGIISLPSNESAPSESVPVEEFRLYISSNHKKIQFDSVRANAQNRMLIDKMNQKASPSIFTGNRALSY